MNKLDFLDELYHYLLPLPKEEREEILNDFREHFREGEAAGKSQQQICEELGSPSECAKQYIGERTSYTPKYDAVPKEEPTDEPKSDKKEEKKAIRKKAFWTAALVWNIVQAIVSVPVTITIFIIAALMCVLYAFVVPPVGSTAFLVFAIASTVAVLSLGVITLLWAIIEIKECIKMINK